MLFQKPIFQTPSFPSLRGGLPTRQSKRGRLAVGRGRFPLDRHVVSLLAMTKLKSPSVQLRRKCSKHRRFAEDSSAKPCSHSRRWIAAARDR
jgi:hypothetical protein